MRGFGAAAAVAALLLASACSDSGGKDAAAGATPAPAPSTAVPTTVAAGGVGPSVATTAIPGDPSATTPGGTVAPQATTTIPLTPPASTSPAPTDGSGGDGDTADPDATAPTSAPGPTSPPGTDITDGDPVAFCAAVDRVLPLYYVMLIASLDDDATAAADEISVAPALSGPLTEAATSAPSVVAPPFQRWAERAALGVAAFKSAGATDAQVASFGQSFAAEVEDLTDAGGAQSPPDPVQAATAAGIDGNQLMAAANRFAQANGSFETFAETLGEAFTLTPAAEQELEQRYPCAADLSNFTS